jgi:hypothetical protein
MRAFDSTLILPLGLLAILAGAALAIALARAARARRRARRRTVELPNSHYTSQLARAVETRHRWHGIALDKVHEINREEVLRLLAKVEALGVDALRPNERVFLDNMARLAGTRPPEPHDKGTAPLSPDLRHRPA